MNAELLYDLLSEHFQVERYGRGLKTKELSLPIFYNIGTEIIPGKTYIARTIDLPNACNADCLFICIGSHPTHVFYNWQGEILFVNDRSLDILALFNFLMEQYDRITNWIIKMQNLLEKNADVEEFANVSLPIFQNGITITDYDLRILVNCDIVRSSHNNEIVIMHELKRIPDEVSSAFKSAFQKYNKIREPFSYKGQQNNPEGDNYCINLFAGDLYLGNCTLWNIIKPMRESDYILFQLFASYISKSLTNRPRALNRDLVTIKSIFSDLLQCFPVSKADLESAQMFWQRNMMLQGIQSGQWFCFVIRSANRDKTLPPAYLCSALEDKVPNASAIFYNDHIVCYCMVPRQQNSEDYICDNIAAYLSDMNFRAGISEAFEDIFKARDYFMQATAVLETGYRLHPTEFIYRFSDYALPYMLFHCVGEFEPMMLLSNGLQELQEAGMSVDYKKTLRQYLDNECNSSRTAQDLFLHRSSLLPRLEKMKSLVKMDTPEQRLYLRICLYLQDYLEMSKRN